MSTFIYLFIHSFIHAFYLSFFRSFFQSSVFLKGNTTESSPNFVLTSS